MLARGHAEQNVYRRDRYGSGIAIDTKSCDRDSRPILLDDLPALRSERGERLEGSVDKIHTLSGVDLALTPS